MASSETPNPPNPSQHLENHSSPSKWRAFLFWTLPAAALLLAVSLSFVLPPPPTVLRPLRSIIPSHHSLKPNLIHRLSAFLSPPKQWTNPSQIHASARPPCVRWMAPFLSGGGYSSEAWAYITALDRKNGSGGVRIKIEQHGDLESLEFWNGLPAETQELGYRLHNTECSMRESIVICHSEPGAWYPPLFQTVPCPPTGYGEPKFVIGRTMFETDRLNAEHVRRCNQMDAVWVPTEFHVSTFVRSGVDPSKVVKVIQPVDVNFFDPSKYKPMDLPCRVPVLGSSMNWDSNSQSCREVFVFLSIFKWEYRKGWDVLLKAYLKEFSGSDGVALYLLTNPYHSDKDFRKKIKQFVGDSGVEEPADGWAPIHVIDTHVAQSDLPRVYKAANVFVLPSRGEGWGRPIVEAMAMSLPVIATNWSGPTEYLTEENGYPLPVDHMSKVEEGPFRGHLRAEPSVEKLRFLMRQVMDNPEEARRRGCSAREDMIRRFSPEVVTDIVIGQILRISKKDRETIRLQ